MSCGISNGQSILCTSLRRIGGVRKVAYLFNIGDVSSYTTDVDGYITAITFDSYTGLHKFEAKKQSHSGGYTVVNQEGGNKFYQHDVTMKAFTETPADDQVLENLLVAEVGVILEDNNGRFFLYGKDNGLEQTDGSQNTGTAPGSDIADNLTLTGQETEKPKRFLDTNEATTKAYLESLVV